MNFAPPPCKPSNEPYTVPLPVYTLCGVEALLGEPLRHHGAGQRIGHPCPHLLALAQRASPYLTVITGFSNSKENMPNCLTRTREQQQKPVPCLLCFLPTQPPLKERGKKLFNGGFFPISSVHPHLCIHRFQTIRSRPGEQQQLFRRGADPRRTLQILYEILRAI